MAGKDPWKVLLIDDEADIREVVSVTLEDAGYTVFQAGDGETGLRLCDAETPQIVITDIRMPGLDGIGVLAAVKKSLPDTEVIVVTAFGEMQVAIRALQLDASDFINKPIDDQALHLALQRAKDRYTTRKALKDYTALLEREKAKTARELVKTFSFQKNLIESSMDGILGCDEADQVVTFNRSMERLLGIPRKRVLHRMTWQQCFAPEDAKRFAADLDGSGYGGCNRLFLYETVLKGADQRRLPVQVSAVRLTDGDVPAGLVCFFRDLREIRALEREMEDQARILHQDKMMSLGKLAASVVHEINNPLSGILNYIRLMTRIMRRGPLPDDRREKFMQYLDLVEAETDRCSHIVSSLLDFSRKSPPAFGEIDIGKLIARCVSLSRHKLELQNIALASRTDTDLPAVTGDFNQLQQCVINLVFNAIDAMPDGGRLDISAGYEPDRRQVAIAVRDTGCGIKEADVAHVFEPFFTTKKEGYGVGLGLSTVFGIMEHHGGSVGVTSRVGQGTTVTLRLPVPDRREAT